MSEIKSAPGKLLALAGEMRPGWDIGQLELALSAAASAGWSWPRTFGYVSDLLMREDAEPRDLTMACRDPLARGNEPPPDPQVRADMFAEAMAAAEQARQAAAARAVAAQPAEGAAP